MKKLFIFLLFFSIAFAEFQFRSLDISITINEDGSANVKETIELIAFGEYSMQLYESGYKNNTLAAWQELTNITEITTHLSRITTDIKKNLIVRPQPLQKSPSGLKVWYGKIIVEYPVYPYYDEKGKPLPYTGVIIMEKYKPRTIRYTLNERAFNLPRTESGDIKLGEGVTLSLIPPPTAQIINANPLPADMYNVQFPTYSKTVTWSALTLIQLSLVYEVEQGLDKEVVEFFTELRQNISISLSSREGIAALTVILLLVLAYFYLKLSRK